MTADQMQQYLEQARHNHSHLAQQEQAATAARLRQEGMIIALEQLIAEEQRQAQQAQPDEEIA